MSGPKELTEPELTAAIAERTGADPRLIGVVLRHEQTYINNAKEDDKGEVEIDSDELIDYILSRPGVKSDELTVESILDAEMDILMERGLAGYVD